jgi:hypothetical protein
LWKEVVKSKYGDRIIGRVVLGEESKPWFSSLWWRDICSIGSNLDSNWFANGVVKRMGNGRNTSFWEDSWVGDTSLRESFPRLFSISVQQEDSVADLWNTNGEEGWNLRWRRRLFEWEKALLNELLAIINLIQPNEEVDDWRWKEDEGGVFTVKSTYSLMASKLLMCRVLGDEQKFNFKAIWKSPAPSKVAGFAWQVLLDRVPTRENLFRRKILQPEDDKCCVFCGVHMESIQHLFLYCGFVLKVWEQVFVWLRLSFFLPHSVSSLLNLLGTSSGQKHSRKGRVMIWNAMIWGIWRHRNQIVFDNGVKDSAKLLDDVKLMAWKWWISRGTQSPCLLYEWISEPEICLSMK